ncbi:uncharacterized protein UBRO_20111 [Ustilago bromivora]|uniref:Metallo-beta-lactamase domain-containing protein n=1 Tax=Ustilago bromivora TaxID=307758 RepID=A0A1K0FWE6_9BASI|nr:uncharacterized protein UBRO_20111 [Ustilago bromivora]SYW75802.1 uncharacterized protein UBRO2_00957 [Ustilago bromivora]
MSQQSIEQFWDQDADLAVCTTCGNQYSSQQGPPECPVCYVVYNTSCGQLVLSQALQLQFSSGIVALANPSLAFFIIVSTDDRRYPCPTGQAYTSQRQLLPKTTFQFVPEESDDRILRLKFYPPVAIGQTAILLLTRYGAVIWDCCGFVSVELVEQVCKLSPTGKVAAIFISHPHFFGTSLTWAKMLNCNVFISRLDRQWYQRGLDSTHPHPGLAARKQYIIEIQEDRSIPPQIPSVTLIRCGSHFPGSKALHWDRDAESQLCPDAKGAAVFCADTFMVMPDCKRFTFAYSFPNNIPLPPHDVEKIWMQMRPFQWSATFGGWSSRQILSDSRSTLLRSARYYIKMEGHPVDTFKQLREEQA